MIFDPEHGVIAEVKTLSIAGVKTGSLFSKPLDRMKRVGLSAIPQECPKDKEL
ncbi:MAG TPA: hypothetical protein VFC84_16170 [Desulfosporosinus sp.]|nr:hypothetical protein [Desulfosporosinus sp.]